MMSYTVVLLFAVTSVIHMLDFSCAHEIVVGFSFLSFLSSSLFTLLRHYWLYLRGYNKY